MLLDGPKDPSAVSVRRLSHPRRAVSTRALASAAPRLRFAPALGAPRVLRAMDAPAPGVCALSVGARSAGVARRLALVYLLGVARRALIDIDPGGPVTPHDLRESILDWLDDNYHFGDARSLVTSDDTSWLDAGILDSVGFVALVLWLEESLSIQLDRASLTRENFGSLGRILARVAEVAGPA